jgi:GNAT superfamily N-acetyltransferase
MTSPFPPEGPDRSAPPLETVPVAGIRAARLCGGSGKLAEPLDNAQLSRIEDAGLNASAPPQQRWVDGWLVRLSPGKAQRSRCINAVSDGQLLVGERLAVCQSIYRRAGLQMLVRITPFSRPSGLDDLLAGQGYQRFDDTEVMVCGSLAAIQTPNFPESLRLENVYSGAYAHIVGEFRGTPEPAREAHAQRLLNSPVPYRGAVLREADGTVLACAQVAIESDMVGLYDVFTAVPARRRGLSRSLCAHLLCEARQSGARIAYLQVDSQNHAAHAMYQRLGFADAYRYHYRARPAEIGGAD